MCESISQRMRDEEKHSEFLKEKFKDCAHEYFITDPDPLFMDDDIISFPAKCARCGKEMNEIYKLSHYEEKE